MSEVEFLNFIERIANTGGSAPIRFMGPEDYFKRLEELNED